MGRFWMITLTMTLTAISGRAQQAALPADTAQTAAQPATDNINPPKLLNIVDAEFSDEARAKNINGRCSVSLTVDVNGIPHDLHVIRCTDSSFEQSSLDAVAKYRFNPATTLEGKPIPDKIVIGLHYRSSNASDPPTPIRFGFRSEERRVGKECRSRWSPH